MNPDKKKKLQAKLRALIAEGDRLHAGATMTSEQTTRAAAVNDEMADLCQQLEPDFQRASYSDMRSQIDRAGRQQPLERGDVDLTEDRGDYGRWPVAEAGDFFRAVQVFGQTRTLPGSIHPELRDTLAGALEMRSPTGMGTMSWSRPSGA